MPMDRIKINGTNTRQWVWYGRQWLDKRMYERIQQIREENGYERIEYRPVKSKDILKPYLYKKYEKSRKDSDIHSVNRNNSIDTINNIHNLK